MRTQDVFLAKDTVLVFLKDSFTHSTVPTINQCRGLRPVVLRDPVLIYFCSRSRYNLMTGLDHHSHLFLDLWGLGPSLDGVCPGVILSPSDLVFRQYC